MSGSLAIILLVHYIAYCHGVQYFRPFTIKQVIHRDRVCLRAVQPDIVLRQRLPTNVDHSGCEEGYLNTCQ